MADLKHVMVDLETMGTMAGCVGLSIGCVVMDFETGELGEEFYIVVNRADSLDRFLREEESTRTWWAKQSADARQVLNHADDIDMSVSLPEAMQRLNDWLIGVGATIGKCRLYGNGADFDNPILRLMWDAAGVLPFNSSAGFFGGRCYRTLKNLDELFGPMFSAPKVLRTGTHHNALDDAKHQARHLIEIVGRVKGNSKPKQNKELK